MSKIKDLLEEEIVAELDGLTSVPYGSKEYASMIEGISKLTERWNALQKSEEEHEMKVESLKKENEDRTKKYVLDVVDKSVGHAISATEITLAVMLTVWGTKATFEFEKEGTYTTVMGRGFINRLIPKKW